MKNEVKLNKHLFFPEQQNEEFSDKQDIALKELIKREPVDAENSIEKFTSELENRFNSIKEILDDETSDFLGYNQEDIETIKNFFDGKYKKFGMDAVAVQKILRSIWLKTPCKDKCLSYDLYDCIDKKFYGIINERKKNINFDDIAIPADSSWETLKENWEARRNRYAEALQIDLEYLDTEAINGLEFPSASGLFANPSSLRHALDFLNYWMPHIKKHKEFNKEIEIFIPKISTKKSWMKKYIDFFKINNFMEAYTLPMYRVSQKDIIDFLRGENIASSNAENYLDVLAQEKEAWYNYIKPYCEHTQPSDFFMINIRHHTKKESELFYSNINNEEETYNPDYCKLPNFINSCDEFVKKDEIIIHGKYLSFYKGKKFYLPKEQNCEILTKVCAAYEATEITMPYFNCNDDIRALTDYYDNAWIKMDEFKHSGKMYAINASREDIPSIMKKHCNEMLEKYPRTNIFYYKGCEFIKSLKKCVEHYANDTVLSNLYKVRILATIEKEFSGSEFLKSSLEPYIEKCIDELSKNGNISPAEATSFNLADEINYFYKLQEYEKLKLEAKVEKARVAERDSVITTICHNINGTIGSIKTNLDSSVQNAPDNIQFSLKRALDGAEMIGNMVNQILKSYKYTKEQFLYDIAHPDENGYRFEDMLHENLDIIIENTFSDAFRNEQKYFFSDEIELQELKDNYYKLQSNKDILNFINKNFANIKIEIPQNLLNIKIGNKNGTATNIYVLLNEFIKNAFRALAYVPFEERTFTFKAFENENEIIYEIKNSCRSTHKTDLQARGFGSLITSKIVEAFGELKKNSSEDGQSFSIKVIISKKEGAL